jgi:hypothetical protein
VLFAFLVFFAAIFFATTIKEALKAERKEMSR